MRTKPLLLAVSLICTVTLLQAQGGCQWTPVGAPILPGMFSDHVKALAVFEDWTGSNLYAGGSFGGIGGIVAGGIGKWDGTVWSPVGSGLYGVRALAVFDDGTGPALYAGGDFTNSGGVAMSGVARWDGFSWSAVGGGMNGSVRAFVVHDDGTGPALYAGGLFTTAGGISANRVARWDGIAWSAVGVGMNDGVLTLGSYDDGSGPALYAGGLFTTNGMGSFLGRFAKWDGSVWSPVAGGLGANVWVMSVYDEGAGPVLFVGGDFTQTGGGIQTRRIARWDGAQWSAVGTPASLGGGVNNSVRSMAVFDDGGGPVLYAGGYFTATISGIAAPYIARWDGISWAGLGPWAGAVTRGMTVHDDGTGPALYAAGQSIGFPTGSERLGCGSSISLSATQPGGPGSPVFFNNTNLTPAKQYYNLFSLDPCPQGPGTGPYFGLCITTQSNLTFMLSQLQLPLGSPPFNFQATSSYTNWGPFSIPMLTVDALCFEYTAGTIGAVAPVTQIVIQ